MAVLVTGTSYHVIIVVYFCDNYPGLSFPYMYACIMQDCDTIMCRNMPGLI